MKAAGANSAWIYNYAPWIDTNAENLEVYVPGYSLSDDLVGSTRYSVSSFYSLSVELDVSVKSTVVFFGVAKN